MLAGDAISSQPHSTHGGGRQPSTARTQREALLGIADDGLFAPETQVLGNPRDARTAYYIRPFGWPVIECFVGGDGARTVESGPAAGFAYAIDQLSALFGSGVRHKLHPLVASGWSRMTRRRRLQLRATGPCGGAGCARAPFEQRLFFAGEATNPHDFSTAHGAA